MFRGLMPVLTLAVFVTGLGIGLAWSRGLIPLSVSPANSGKLSVEVTDREPLPPPNNSDSSLASLDPPSLDPMIFENQTEPAGDDGLIVASNTVNNDERTQTIPASKRTESIDTEATEPAAAAPKKNPVALRVKTRERSAVQIDKKAGIEVEDSVPNRRIKTTAHEETEVSAEAPPATRIQSDDSEKSPAEMLALAEAKLASGEILAAHRDLSKIYWNHKDLRPQLQPSLDKTAKAIFFQSKPNFVEPYVVQEGERLQTIAKKYQLSWEYMAKLNRTEPRRIQIGQKLKVVKGPFGAIVDLNDFCLTIHLQGYYVKHYEVGIGKEDSSPNGQFTVLEKLENPQYTGPDGKVIDANDPRNPLGERWIDLGDSYGIHGTIDPDSIGKAESRGCIRLRDQDIIEVYDFLVKGSEVVIRP